MPSAASSPIAARSVWRHIHRPEDYASDAGAFVMRELRLPLFLMKPFVPLVQGMVRKWPPAAVETTAFTLFADGSRLLRTYFEITRYDSNGIYVIIERTLKKMGVGAGFLRKYEGIEFVWVLLGGILLDYGKYAGIDDSTARTLVDFRMPLSDYFMAVTWYVDRVEITNMNTGRTDCLSLPPREIAKIVDWASSYQNHNTPRSAPLPGDARELEHFVSLERIYEEIKGKTVIL